MASEQGYFYSFHHADPIIIAQIVEEWGSKGNSIRMNGGETTELYQGNRLFGWACYNLLTNVDSTKEESSESFDISEGLIRALSPAKILHLIDINEKNWNKANPEFKLFDFPDAEEFQIAA